MYRIIDSIVFILCYENACLVLYILYEYDVRVFVGLEPGAKTPAALMDARAGGTYRGEIDLIHTVS